MGSWDNNIWSWKLDWSVPLTESETSDAAESLLLLEQVQPRRDCIDRRRWIPNTASFFSVQSAYAHLQNSNNMAAIDSNMLIALKKLWKNNVPFE
ncbi:hypothetical protein L195_g060109, partial [Trifolium pratense]